MDEIPDKYRTDLAIIRETADQINRDINLEGFSVVISGNELTAFNELREQLTPFVSKMFKGNRQTFQSLLYRIDISERDFRKLLQEGDSGESNEKLAELIIRREFQKVLTRRYFSGRK